jgi:hypothetical protein
MPRTASLATLTVTTLLVGTTGVAPAHPAGTIDRARCLTHHSARFCEVNQLRHAIPATRAKVVHRATRLLATPVPRAQLGWRVAPLRRELRYWRRALPQVSAPEATPWASWIPRWRAWMCIHAHEGPWNARTGNGYYGGLQMDMAFQRRYGADFLRRFGTADRWPAAAQVLTAERAYRSGRGFWPWPNTARACGLL